MLYRHTLPIFIDNKEVSGLFQSLSIAANDLHDDYHSSFNQSINSIEYFN